MSPPGHVATAGRGGQRLLHTCPRGPRAPGTTVTTGAPTTTRPMAWAAAETTGPTTRRPPRDTRVRPGLPGPRARPVRRLPGMAGDSLMATTRPTDWPGPAGRAPGKACTKPTARRTTTTGAKPGRDGTRARPAPPRTPRTRPTGKSRAPAAGPPRCHLPSTRGRPGRGPAGRPRTLEGVPRARTRQGVPQRPSAPPIQARPSTTGALGDRQTTQPRDSN